MRNQPGVTLTARPRILATILSLLLFLSTIFYSCSDNGNKFLGKWRSGSTNAEITKNGDYYLMEVGYKKIQLKYADGELQSEGIYGNITYNKDNGNIYFAGEEFEKQQ